MTDPTATADDAGVTTEAALDEARRAANLRFVISASAAIDVFLIGVMVLGGQPASAVGIAIGTTVATLAFAVWSFYDRPDRPALAFLITGTLSIGVGVLATHQLSPGNFFLCFSLPIAGATLRPRPLVAVGALTLAVLAVGAAAAWTTPQQAASVATEVGFGIALWSYLLAIAVLESRTGSAAIRNAIELTRRAAAAEAEQRALAEQLQHAQRLESLGRLAGAIAHDFNNVLTIVQTGASLARHKLPPEEPARRLLDEISAAAKSAAGLTQKLLAFSRHRVVLHESCSPSVAVAPMVALLPRLLGGTVRLRARIDDGLPPVPIGAVQLEQVLVNLATNARDAMPDGGELEIELHERTAALDPGADPRPCVALVVRDHGQGMSEEVRARIFDPFFTTKGAGRGTGLGLATCYGIARQAGGRIEVESELGAGTTFTVLLPVTAGTPGKQSVVLIVDDESVARMQVARVLVGRGHVVAEASDAESALAFTRSRHVDVVLSDVGACAAGDGALVERLREITPGLRVVLTAESEEALAPARSRLGGVDGVLRACGDDVLTRAVEGRGDARGPE